MNKCDFEQNVGIENQNGKLKKKNFNKIENISDFLIETEKKQNGNLKRKITTNREIFGRFLIISELSNKAEKPKKRN